MPTPHTPPTLPGQPGWGRKLLRNRVPPTLPGQPGAGAPAALTCQAAEFSRPQLAQAARAITVGEWLRARVQEWSESQQFGPWLHLPASHDPGLPAALSRPAGPQ